MPTAPDILWFKQEFADAIRTAVQGTPFDVDMIAAIACQETGYIWRVLRKKSLSTANILALCVGDTLDASAGRKAFPRTKAELVAQPQGAQMFAIARQALDGHLEDRIVAKSVAVVGVLVTSGNRHHPQPQHLYHRMLNAIRLAPLADASGKPRRDPQASLDLAQQEHAAIRRQHAAIKAHAHFLAPNGWKIERQTVIVVHGGCGAPR